MFMGATLRNHSMLIIMGGTHLAPIDNCGIVNVAPIDRTDHRRLCNHVTGTPNSDNPGRAGLGSGPLRGFPCYEPRL